MELAADLMMEMEKEGGSKKKKILFDQERTVVFKGKLKPATEVPKNISLVMMCVLH